MWRHTHALSLSHTHHTHTRTHTLQAAVEAAAKADDELARHRADMARLEVAL